MKKKRCNTIEDCIKNFHENKGHPFKIILGFYKGEGWTMVKSTLCIILMQLPVWVIPIVTSNVINIATNPTEHALRELFINALVAAIVVLQNAFSTYGIAMVYDRLVRKIEYFLRSSLIQKLQQLSMSFHKNVNSGKLQSKIMRDCENVEVLLAEGYRSFLIIFMSIAVAISVTACNSPVVILFFVAVVPLEVLLLRALRGVVRRRNAKFRKEIEVTQSGVSEMIELIPVTRAHGLQQREVNKMNSRLGSVMTAGYQLDKTISFFGASTWVLSEISRLSCLFFTGYLAYKGKISVGEVVLYQTYFSQIVNSVSGLLNMYPRMTKGLESIQSISEVLYEERVETDNSIIPLPDMKGKVEFCDICYRYPDSDSWVLENFSLTVQAGESVAFVGASGAGKTTLLDLLIGFDRPNEGQILIDRVNMLNLDMTEYRSQIAVVPQNTILFAGTIRDNITYGLDDVSDEEVLAVIKSVGLDDLLETLPNGIYTHLGEHGGKLSGGQRQRIAIARALLRKPKIIIFDEATSALDSASEKKVQAAVDTMMKQCTTFMVAHRLSTIRNVDRIVVLSHGAVIEEGSYDELMAKEGAFYRLKRMQE